MTAEKPQVSRDSAARSPERARAAQAKPEWTNGLRQLYESVVDEPLPDAFRDLLSQLDKKD